MTMDYTNQSRSDIKMPSPRISSSGTDGSITKIDYSTKNNIKRSFDVAFLMLPDEKLKHKQQQQQQEKQPRLVNAHELVTYPQISVKSGESLKQQPQQNGITQTTFVQPAKDSPNSDLEIELLNNNEESRTSRYTVGPVQFSRSPRIYDDPSINSSPSGRSSYNDSDIPKSAFTKVPHGRQESPIPPLSPDQLSCPSSSPPISASPPQHMIYQNFRPEYRFMNNGQFAAINQMHSAHQNAKFKQQFVYRPIQNQNSNELPAGYVTPAGFPFGAAGHPFAPQPDLSGIVRNPAAAALLSTLIPPTLATTFTLTAQNVCAKCNISFRMTSDLVYHMRSHHKSEMSYDLNRRKREEKLRCPVCNETFRERHHLTRHMTAHQDKASDEAETIQMQRRHK